MQACQLQNGWPSSPSVDPSFKIIAERANGKSQVPADLKVSKDASHGHLSDDTLGTGISPRLSRLACSEKEGIPAQAVEPPARLERRSIREDKLWAGHYYEKWQVLDAPLGP